MLQLRCYCRTMGVRPLGRMGVGTELGQGGLRRSRSLFPSHSCRDAPPGSEREGRCNCFPPGMQYPPVPQGQHTYSRSISRSCPIAIPPLIFNATCFHILLLCPCLFRADGFSSPFPLCLAAFFFFSFLDSHFFVQKAPGKVKEEKRCL